MGGRHLRAQDYITKYLSAANMVFCQIREKFGHNLSWPCASQVHSLHKGKRAKIPLHPSGAQEGASDRGHRRVGRWRGTLGS